jgi:DNA repair protein RecN (Recombination protein N)
MLRELYIENLAVIERAAIPFEPGLNVFTGETGAGKSVLVGGLSAALGRRVSKDLVRTGAQRATVTAVFDALPEGVFAFLREMGIADESADAPGSDNADESVLLTREITADGRSTARINNRPVTAAALQTLGAMLCDIHGQRDSAILTDAASHLGLLDDFGDYDETLIHYKEKFRELGAVSRTLAERLKQSADAAANIERHRRIRDDIAPYHFKPGEDEEVDFLFEQLENTENVKAAADFASRALSNDEDSFEGALERLYAAERELLPFVKSFPVLETVLGDIVSAEQVLESVLPTLSSFTNSMGTDEDKLRKISSRKDEIDRVKKLYGGPERSLQKALDLCAESMAALELVTNGNVDIERLQKQKQALLTEVSAIARELSAKRAETAKRLSAAIEAELRELDMAQVAVSFAITPGKLTKSGMDTVELLFSPNPGEEPRPLAKIASGGELSRFMLALKSVSQIKNSEQLVMVFDEIDTGVSGRAAAKIGRKLADIARRGEHPGGGKAGEQVRGQAIVISHLAQIAVCAEHHLLIEKAVENGRTFTKVTPIAGEARVREIARIQVGDNITELALRNAREQLENYRKS